MSPYVASLGMYDHPAQQAANDRLWGEIARLLVARGVAGVPARLDRSRSVQDIWRDPALLLGQACGYPLAADRRLTLRVLALPTYDLPRCGDATHGSVLVARAEDGRETLAAYRHTRAAINDRLSNTGMNLFRATIAPIARASVFFDAVIETGSHRASMAAIAAGEADLAAIDAVTYAALDRHEPDLTAALRIVAHSPESPTLPFVTSATTPIDTVAAVLTALTQVLHDPGLADARALLGLSGVTPAGPEALAPVLALEAIAIDLGYPVLR